MSTPVRNGIYQKLVGTSAVTNLVGQRIYYEQAPTDADYPLIVFSKSSGTKERAMGANAFFRSTWLVKAIDRNTLPGPAEAIAAAVDNALDLGTITVSGRTLADLNHVGDVNYTEASGDQQYRHAGATYRITLT